MDEQRYTIGWAVVATGAQGQAKSSLTQQDAEAWIETLEAESSGEIRYWLIPEEPERDADSRQ